jgi:glucosyl-dolichyl phosphate glucuronosyltransferase
LVDNNCTDDTQAVVGSFAGRLPIRAVVERTAGLSHARNRVLEEARGECVLFTDDDVRVPPNWVCEFCEGAGRHPEAAVFGGPIEPWFPEPPAPELLEAFPLLRFGFCGTDYPPIEAAARNLPIFGANMGLRMSCLGSHRFDSRLGAGLIVGRGGEETELIRRLERQGAEAVWLPLMTVQHYVDPRRMSLDYLCSYYEGRGGTHIRFEGFPRGATVLGRPRWLVRKHVEAAVRTAANQLMGRRSSYLRALRDYYETRGMLRECAIVLSEGHAAQQMQ